MNISRSANPALNKDTFINARTAAAEGTMTIQGTVNKIFIMLLLVIVAASYTWKFMAAQDLAALKIYMIGGAIGGFIVAILTVFKKTWAPFTAPVYAVLEGLFLGGISAVFEAQYPGIVINAVALTFGTLFALLFAYKSGKIKVTENFKLGVVAATGGIAFVYLFSFILSMFGVQLGFIHGNGILSIIISLVVVVVAAMNLVLDFDFIESGAEAGAPKYMEWYGAFGLIVTLVWLYIEFLRLLSKIASRN